MTRFHRLLGVLIGWSAVGFGCSSAAERTVAPVLVDHDVQGSWGPAPLPLNPGSQFLMALTESAGVVTGTGTFAGEAAAGGALAISGSVRNDSLHLQVVFLFDPRFAIPQPDTASFEGVLSARDTIDGTLTDRGIAQSMQLVRLRVGDPP
jgi:hypothetical protein